MKLPILQQSASSLRSLSKLGHLKCPQINFIPAFYSGYKGSALLDGLLVFLLQETAVRTWSFWTCHRWRWPVGEGISGCGAGSGRCTFLGLDSLAEDWERNGRGSFEGRTAPGPCPVQHKRASKKTGEGDLQGHLPWSQGTASLAPESAPSSPPSLAPSSPRGSHQQLRERKGKWGSLGERQDDHSRPPLVLTEKIKSTTWELRAKSYLGHIEDYSPGDNISDSFETALQRSRGKDRTCMILMKGSTWNQVHILAEAGC